MSIAVTSAELQHASALAEAELSAPERCAAAARAPGEEAPEEAGATVAPFYMEVPAASAFAVAVDALAAAPGGYAAARAGSSTAAKAKGSSTGKARGQLAFLDDRNLGIEDKLFRFMLYVQQKNDLDLERKMKAYAARFGGESPAAPSRAGGSGTSTRPADTGGSGSSGAGSQGTSLFGSIAGQALDVLEQLYPPLKTLASTLGKELMVTLMRDLGAELLTGIAAAGLDVPAPVMLLLKKVADTVATRAAEYVKSHLDDAAAGRQSLAPAAAGSGATARSGGASGASSGATSGGADSPDERIAMFELQRLAEKQQAMFSAISNTLRAMHEAQMTAVGNIR